MITTDEIRKVLLRSPKYVQDAGDFTATIRYRTTGYELTILHRPTGARDIYDHQTLAQVTSDLNDVVQEACPSGGPHEPTVVDYGVGTTEFWGAVSTDTNEVVECSKCGQRLSLDIEFGETADYLD